jgi:DivIVA domain-containing protein
VTPTPQHDFPYYRSPAAIRGEGFSHRMRGLDEDEVREYLHLLADQVEASEQERSTLHAEVERLRGEAESLRREVQDLRTSRPEAGPDEISPQAVILFSQAQQVADQLVEEAVLHARDLMSSARHQQREIMEQAHRAAETAARDAAQADGRSIVSAVTAATTDYATPVPEIEYVRTFARVAQAQLRSVVEALSDEVEKLSEVPRLDRESRNRWLDEGGTSRALTQGSSRPDPFPRQHGS